MVCARFGLVGWVCLRLRGVVAGVWFVLRVLEASFDGVVQVGLGLRLCVILLRGCSVDFRISCSLVWFCYVFAGLIVVCFGWFVVWRVS